MNPLFFRVFRSIQMNLDRNKICVSIALGLALLFAAPVVSQESSSTSEVREHQLELTDARREEIQYYIKLLDSGNPYLDDWSRRNLIQLGSTAVPPLLDALESEPPRKRFLICEILGEIRDPKAVPALIKRLEDEEANPSVASAAAYALGKLGDRRAVDPLKKHLDAADRELLYNTIVALGNLRAKETADRILKKVDDDRTEFFGRRIGNAALMALGKMRHRGALKKIKSILTSDEKTEKEQPTGLPVVFYAVRALEQIALTTKGPVMVGGEKEKKTRQKTIDAWVTWINNELGIEPEKKEGSDASSDEEGEGTKKGGTNESSGGTDGGSNTGDTGSEGDTGSGTTNE